MTKIKKQECLCDRTENGKERPWGVHKVGNEHLSMAYEDVDAKKAVRLKTCANVLVFDRNPESGRIKLDHANFCRVRLCPICTWRRSLKAKAQGLQIIEAMNAEYPYQWVLLTLTLRNCVPDALRDTIDAMTAAWQRFVKIAPFRALMDNEKHPGGWFRACEITHDVNEWITPRMIKDRPGYYSALGLAAGDRNPNYDTYHPHFHVLLALPKSYFDDSKKYISQAKWSAMWKKAMRLNYTPIVDVRKAYDSRSKTIAEAMKYSVKSADYIIPDDWNLTVETVRLLDAVLNKRRFAAFGGAMKKWHKILNLDDPEDGDLVHVDDPETDGKDADKHLVSYVWFTGYRQYIRQ